MRKKFPFLLLFFFIFSNIKCFAVEDIDGYNTYIQEIYKVSEPWILDNAARDAQNNISNRSYLESKLDYYLNLAENKTLDTNDLNTASIYASYLGKDISEEYTKINDKIYNLKKEGKLNEERIALQTRNLPITSSNINIGFTVVSEYKGDSRINSTKFGAYANDKTLINNYTDRYSFICEGSNNIYFSENYVYTRWNEKADFVSKYPQDRIAGLTYSMDNGNLKVKVVQTFSNKIKRKDKDGNLHEAVGTEVKLLGYAIESFQVRTVVNRYQGRGSYNAETVYYKNDKTNTKTTASISSSGKILFDYAGQGNLFVDVIFGVKYFVKVKTLYDPYVWKQKIEKVKKLEDYNGNGIKGEVYEVWNDKNKNKKKDPGEVTYIEEWTWDDEVTGGNYVFDDKNAKEGVTYLSDYQTDFNNMYQTTLKRVKYTSNGVPIFVNGFYAVNYIGRNYRSTSLKMDAMPQKQATLSYK